MSNYTGGGRNYARRRHGDVASRTQKSHFARTGFTSRGFATPKLTEPLKNLHFDLSHAKDASITSLKQPASETNIARIDSVQPDWIMTHSTSPPKQPRRSRVLEALNDIDENAKGVRVRRLLQRSNLIGLPPQTTEWCQAIPPSTGKRPLDVDDSLTSSPIETFKKRKVAPSPDETDSKSTYSNTAEESTMSNESPHSTDDSKANFWDISSDLEDQNPFDDQLATSEDEILSFPSTPHPQTSEFNLTQAPRPSEENNAFFVDHSPSPQSISSQTPSQADNESTTLSSIPSDIDHFLDGLKHETQSIAEYPEERLRLPGDKTGIGASLTRWVGDNASEDEELVLRVTAIPYLEEEDEESPTGMTWVQRPYEDHLPPFVDSDQTEPLILDEAAEHSIEGDEVKDLFEKELEIEKNSVIEKCQAGEINETETQPPEFGRDQYDDSTFTLAPALFDW